MDAKELHDRLLPMNFRGSEQWQLDIAANADTILRALSLLAAVKGSQDEIVRDTKNAAFFLHHEGMHNEGAAVDKAAAHVLALQAELASVKAELERARDLGNKYYLDAVDAKERLAKAEAAQERIKRLSSAAVNVGGRMLDCSEEVAATVTDYHERLAAAQAELASVKGERDDIKRQAEAMHYAFEECPLEIQCAVFDAYRAAPPKDAQ